MELRVIEKTDDELRIEIAGEDHTFMNVLKGTLLETDGGSAATYDMNPEQSGGQTEPVLSITTEGELDQLDALAEGAESVRTSTDEFKDGIVLGTAVDEIPVEHQYVVVASPVDGMVVDSNHWVVVGMIRECQ